MRTISKTYVFMTEVQHSPLVFAIDNVVISYLWFIIYLLSSVLPLVHYLEAHHLPKKRFSKSNTNMQL